MIKVNTINKEIKSNSKVSKKLLKQIERMSQDPKWIAFINSQNGKQTGGGG